MAGRHLQRRGQRPRLEYRRHDLVFRCDWSDLGITQSLIRIDSRRRRALYQYSPPAGRVPIVSGAVGRRGAREVASAFELICRPEDEAHMRALAGVYRAQMAKSPHARGCQSIA